MRNLFYVVILMVFTACSFSGTRHVTGLEEADRLITVDPAMALKCLNSYDIAEFGDSATMARWAMLYSEAMVANDLYAPTDTIVNFAIDYYERHNLQDEFLHASRLKSLLSDSKNSDELANALYIQKEKEFMLYKERATREQYLLCGLVALLCAIIVILYMHQRVKILVVKNNALMAEAYDLIRQVNVGSKNVSRLEAVLHDFIEDRFALIDSLCQTYYESQGTKIERKAITDKVKTEIDALRNSSFPVMEKVVNECLDNLLDKARKAYPEIKDEEYQLLVYLSGGLSVRTISLLMGESVDVVYKRKSRLKLRLKERTQHLYPDIMGVF